jgi:ankyrin repeat protein
VGDLGIIELLLGHGADVNAPAAQRGGGTAFQLASLNGFIPIVQLFLKHGADVHAPASKVDGRSPLEGAAEHGRLDMITVLLEAGAGSKGKEEPQFTRAITLAEENGHEPVANLLKGYILDGKIRSCANMFEDLVDWNFDE